MNKYTGNLKRTKLVVNGEILEQIKHFNHLGCGISYEYAYAVERTLRKFGRIWNNKDI